MKFNSSFQTLQILSTALLAATIFSSCSSSSKDSPNPLDILAGAGFGGQTGSGGRGGVCNDPFENRCMDSDANLGDSIRMGQVGCVKKLIPYESGQLNARDSSGNTPLQRAVSDDALFFAPLCDRAKIVRLLVDAGADTSLLNSSGNAPVHALLAQSTGSRAESSKAVLDYFIASGKADLNLKDRAGNTPLLLALQKKDTGIAQALLAHKVDPSLAGAGGQTPLLLSLEQNLPEMAIALLNAGANASAADASGNRPLHLAISQGQAPIARLLLAKGADPKALSARQESLLHLAASQGSVEIVNIALGIQPGLDRNARDSKGATALLEALQQSHPEAAELLLNAGTDPNIADGSRSLALHLAASSGYTALVRQLIQKGSRVNDPDASGNTPLLLALQRQHPDTALALIATPAVDVNLAGPRQDSPLHLAAAQDRAELVQQLIARKASPAVKNASLQTPLMLAANRQIAESLLGAGAQVDAEDESGHRPLYFAVAAGRGAVAELLIAKGAELTWKEKSSQMSYLHLAVHHYSNSPAMIQLLARAGISVEIQDAEVKTPAFYARRPEAIQALKGLGATMNAATASGLTLVDFLASRNGLDTEFSDEQLVMVKTLLDSGANPLALDAMKRTYLHKSVGAGRAAMPACELATLFLSKGVDANARTVQGSTALHLANQPRMVELLLKAHSDPKVRDLKGLSPLDLYAAKLSRVEAAREKAVNAGQRNLGAFDREIQLLKAMIALVEASLRG